jgi:hypothetical protein
LTYGNDRKIIRSYIQFIYNFAIIIITIVEEEEEHLRPKAPSSNKSKAKDEKEVVVFLWLMKGKRLTIITFDGLRLKELTAPFHSSNVQSHCIVRVEL